MNWLVGFLLLALLAMVGLWVWTAEGSEIPKYDRKQWMPRGWEDADGDCQDTRAEVLIRDAVPGTIVLSTARRGGDTGCEVVGGVWINPYTGERIVDPRIIDIDHVAPLAWVHRRGGWRWSSEQKRAYANRLDYRDALLAVHRHENRQKADKGPAEWIPAQRAARCRYGEVFAAVVGSEPDLMLTVSERIAIRLLLRAC